jgi:hypothetical protein
MAQDQADVADQHSWREWFTFRIFRFMSSQIRPSSSSQPVDRDEALRHSMLATITKVRLTRPILPSGAIGPLLALLGLNLSSEMSPQLSAKRMERDGRW